MARRKVQTEPYVFWYRKGRPIQVIFAYMPRRPISTGTYDEAEARRFAEKFMANDGILADSGYIPTFAEFAKDFFMRTDPLSFRTWLADYEAKPRKEGYFKARQALLQNYVIPTFGPMLVTAITRLQIERWLVTMTGKFKGRGQKLAANTRNKALWVLRCVLDDVVRHGYITLNPAKEVKGISGTDNPRRALTRAEEMALFPDDMVERLHVWGSDMWTLYFSIFYDTGFRPGEISGLRVSDVYQTPQGLAVCTTHTVDSSPDHGSAALQERVKTTGKGLERRVGLLYDDTADLLKLYVNRYGLNGDDMLFLINHEPGRLVACSTALKHFRLSYRRALGHDAPKNVVQYCIRHTYTTARRGDMPDELLAISMGHTRLRSDYDHRDAGAMIRRLDTARDAFFETRKRRDEQPQIIPFRKVR